MRTTFNKILPVSFFLLLIIPLPQCKEVYVSPYASPVTGYLVVEGYISGNSPTSFALSRTVKLSADTTSPQEPGASVQVEGDDNSVYPLTEQGSGLYGTGVLPLLATVNYRLRVHTRSGGEYLSDYAPYKITPAIDSINWVQDNSGVTIYANAHDDAGNTRYYQWSYDQTWEYHSGEESGYEYHAETNPVSVLYRPPADQIFRCWRNSSSTDILIGSSAKLSKDLIYRQPLNQITANSEQLNVLYSMLVRQYALTEAAYNFLSLMKKNTESLGSIFDAQPSQLIGNIHCLSDPTEQVIGFVSAGTVQQQRIFINRSQLSSWSYAFTCPMKDTLAGLAPDSLKKYFGQLGFVPVSEHFSMIGSDGWNANTASCVDCRTQGGTTDKPAFWPN